MLKERWLNAVHMLSVCHPCLSRDVWRCQRWLGQRLFHVALCGSVLIESGHGPSSGGYVHDAVLSDRTVVEHDTIIKISMLSNCSMNAIPIGASLWVTVVRSEPRFVQIQSLGSLQSSFILMGQEYVVNYWIPLS